MKRKISFFVTFVLAFCLIATSLCIVSDKTVKAAEQEQTNAFFTQTAAENDYSSLKTVPAYQGENSFFVKNGKYNGAYLLTDGKCNWSADGVSTEVKAQAGNKFFPGAKGVTLEWRAAKSGTVSFKGLVYNGLAYENADMSAYGVQNREQTEGQRASLTLSVYLYTANKKLTLLYKNAFNNDFALFADGNEYWVSEGDSFVFTVESENADEYVYMYLGAQTGDSLAKYDFISESTYVDGNIADISANGNYLRFSNEFPQRQVDGEKGLYFEGWSNANGNNISKSFLYSPMYVTEDFTDRLTDFSVIMNFTLDAGESWQYLLSTTSDIKNKDGFAIRTESMGATEDGRSKYALKLCLYDSRELGGDSFYFTDNAWVLDLVSGSKYEMILNVSTTERKAEMFVYGEYANGWVGRNKCTVSISESWSMNNSGNGVDTYGNGMTVGAEDEAGKEGFKGWISGLSVYNYLQTVTECTSTPVLSTMTVTELPADLKAAYKDTQAGILANLNESGNQIELVTDKSTLVYATVNWKEVIYDGAAYYALGTIKADGVKYSSCFIKAGINAYCVKLIHDGAYVGYLTCANNGDGKIAKPQSVDGISDDYDLSFYTDEALNTEFDFDAAITENKSIYVGTTLKQYTITYVLDGGVNSDANPATYNKDSGEIEFADPVKEGYTFDGWYLDDTVKITFLDSTKKENVTLYARWIKNADSEDSGDSGKSGCFSGISGVSGGMLLICAAGIAFAFKKRREEN